MAERIEKGNCPTCGNGINADDFRDELSVKEFGISGMCQECQDGTFLSPCCGAQIVLGRCSDCKENV